MRLVLCSLFLFALSATSVFGQTTPQSNPCPALGAPFSVEVRQFSTEFQPVCRDFLNQKQNLDDRVALTHAKLVTAMEDKSVNSTILLATEGRYFSAVIDSGNARHQLLRAVDKVSDKYSSEILVATMDGNIIKMTAEEKRNASLISLFTAWQESASKLVNKLEVDVSLYERVKQEYDRRLTEEKKMSDDLIQRGRAVNPQIPSSPGQK